MLLVQARPHHADVALLALLVPNLQLMLLEDVHQSPGQLRVKIQVEQMRLGLLLFHDLGKGVVLTIKMFMTSRIQRQISTHLMVLLLLLVLLLAHLLLGGLAVVGDLLLVVLHVDLHLLQPLLLELGELILGHRVLAGQILELLLTDISALDPVLEPLILLLELPDQLVRGVLIDHSLRLDLLCSIG